MSEARIYVTEYRATAWPEDLAAHPDASDYDVIVRPTLDPNLWVITTGAGRMLSVRGSWTRSLPRGFWCLHYRPLDRALADARAAAEALQPVPGMTRDEHVAWVRRQEGAQ